MTSTASGRWAGMRRIGIMVTVLMVTTLVAPVATAGTTGPVNVITTLGNQPEGVAVDKTGNVFVSMAYTGTLLKLAPGSADYEVFGSIDGWGAGQLGGGFLGLAVDAMGNVYGAAQWAGSTGVYKFDRKTGEETLIAGTEQIEFPNSVAFDKTGNLYVTDTNSTGLMNPLNPGDVPLGAVWRIGRDGGVEKWAEDPLLGGTGFFGFPGPIGANGIAYRHGVLYVANSEQATILTIPVRKDGSAGDVSVMAQLPPLAADPAVAPFTLPAVPDGIALDVHGNIYVAVIVQSAILRVNTDGSFDILAHDLDREDLDLPSSVAFGTGNGMKQTLFAVNLAIGPPGGAGPALLSIDVGEPGLPLP